MRNANEYDIALYMKHCENNENPASLQTFIQVRDKALAVADASNKNNTIIQKWR